MNFKINYAKMIAENLQGFLDLVNRTYDHHSYYVLHQDTLYRLKLLVEEFRLKTFAEELFRLTKYETEEKQILMNIEKVHEKMIILEEFIENNQNDLFIFTGRVHSILSIIDTLNNGAGSR
ncbi:MAG: hypothetical protein ACQEUT_12115 [Bacillota bacterium]